MREINDKLSNHRWKCIALNNYKIYQAYILSYITKSFDRKLSDARRDVSVRARGPILPLFRRAAYSIVHLNA